MDGSIPLMIKKKSCWGILPGCMCDIVDFLLIFHLPVVFVPTYVPKHWLSSQQAAGDQEPDVLFQSTLGHSETSESHLANSFFRFN
mmetsp:Transcript_4628/g.8220  ORF Transcript_4628/g.8220 Transcript_4628/m.8220 type:complete len:86 (+) Transcript_4628:611-868(+)